MNSRQTTAWRLPAWICAGIVPPEAPPPRAARTLLRTCPMLLPAVLLCGCAGGRVMMPPPDLYSVGAAAPFDALAPALQTADIDVLYVTDRVPEQDAEGHLVYGIGRSPSVAFGSAVVAIGTDLSWSALEALASDGTRGTPPELTLLSVTELGRAPPTPLPWSLVDGQPVTEPAAVAANEGVGAAFCTEVSRRLALSGRKDALVFVHGVANTFEDSVFTVAELWHFTGREGVPIVFSWPAGWGGLLRGYTYDRESGEFAVYHVKQFLSALAACEGVQRINIIAHSRGTDVTLTALRELNIAERAAGRDPLRTLRLNNVVLAAPDLDFGVTMQRVSSERVVASLHRLTVYTSTADKAISFSEMLFGGLSRIGQLDFLRVRELYPQERVARSSAGNVAFIEYTGTQGGAHGHSYFRENPAVSSDLVLTVRFDRDPGAENGRPLKHLSGDFWAIDDSYLDPRAR